MTPILTAHSLSSMLRTLCVGLNACCRERSDLPGVSLFTTMTFQERKEENMSVANIAFFRQPLEPFTSLQQSSTSILTDKGGSRGGSLVSSSNNSGVDSAAGNRDAVGVPLSGSTPVGGTPVGQTRKSISGKGQKNVLNEANLRELQVQIDPIAEYFSNMKIAIPTVSEACRSRITESSKIAANAIEESRKARSGRGIKMLNSLQELPNLF